MGLRVSTLKVKSSLTRLVFPALSVVLAFTVYVPFKRGTLKAISTFPSCPTVPFPTRVSSSFRSSTVVPASALMMRVGFALLMRVGAALSLSEMEEGLSGVILSTVSVMVGLEVLTFPAASVAVAERVCCPSSRGVVRVTSATPFCPAKALPFLALRLS